MKLLERFILLPRACPHFESLIIIYNLIIFIKPLLIEWHIEFDATERFKVKICLLSRRYNVIGLIAMQGVRKVQIVWHGVQVENGPDQQAEEDYHANQVAPNVDTFIVKHE